MRLFGAAQASLESIHARPWQIIRSEIKRNVAAAREQLGEAAFNVAWAEGRAMILRSDSGQALEQAIAYALEQANNWQ